MRHCIALVVIVGVMAGVACGSALADPPQNNGHNCSGFASSFVPEENLGGISARSRWSVPDSDSDIARQRELWGKRISAGLARSVTG